MHYFYMYKCLMTFNLFLHFPTYIYTIYTVTLLQNHPAFFRQIIILQPNFY